jgi:hypothetical protein
VHWMRDPSCPQLCRLGTVAFPFLAGASDRELTSRARQIPCDHLLCHTCLNALINAAAHKPPRPTDCFCCGANIKSFLPAWAGVGTAAGGRIGLVEALQESLCNGQGGRKAVDENSTSMEAEPVAKGSRRRRNSVGPAAIAATILMSSSKENVGRTRSSSINSAFSVVETGAHLSSPLLLKSKTSQRALAAGAIDQVEYSTSTSTALEGLRSPQASTSRHSHSNSHATSPSRPLHPSRSNSSSHRGARFPSDSSSHIGHARDGTGTTVDSMDTGVGTPGLSHASSPYAQIGLMSPEVGMPQTPPSGLASRGGSGTFGSLVESMGCVRVAGPSCFEGN